MKSKTRAILFIFFTLIAAGISQVPTKSKLYFYSEDLKPEYLAGDFSVLPDITDNAKLELDKPVEDATGDSVVSNFLRTAKSYCVDGYWRFYPAKKYEHTSISGYFYGKGLYRHCDNLPQTGEELASMQSYRYVGPDEWSETYSITVYAGLYYSGDSVIFTAKYSDLDKDQAEVKVDFPVKSFVVTAPVRAEDEPENGRWCSPWLVKVGKDPELEICYILCPEKCPDPKKRNTMFQLLTAPEHVFHSMKLLQDHTTGGDYCNKVIPAAKEHYLTGNC